MKKRNPFAAFLFSVVPPLGQIYNCQLMKGLLLYVILISAVTLAVLADYPDSFFRLAVLVLFLVVFYLYMMIDSVLSAVLQGPVNKKKYNKWYVYILFLLFSLSAAAVPAGAAVFGGHLRVFVISGVEMSPKVNKGDIIVVNTSKRVIDEIKRDDIVLYKTMTGMEPVRLSRCAAVEGDDVEVYQGRLYIDNRQADIRFEKNITLLKRCPLFVKTNRGSVPDEYILVMPDDRTKVSDNTLQYVSKIFIIGKPVYYLFSEDRRKIGVSFM